MPQVQVITQSRPLTMDIWGHIWESLLRNRCLENVVEALVFQLFRLMICPFHKELVLVITTTTKDTIQLQIYFIVDSSDQNMSM